MKLMILAAMALALPLFAGDKEKPSFAEVSMADVKSLVEKKGATFLDANGTESWTKGHIPGAIDFAANEKTLATVLPKDKAALIVAYCGGPQCNAWTKGAEAAAALGYTNIKHFKDGIKGWSAGGGTMEAGTAVKAATFADIDYKELKELVEAKKVFLIDVNGSESFAKGHIPGAVDFAVASKTLADVLPKDKNALVVAYCGNANCPMWKRGADAAAALGYTNVKHFKDGIAGWREAGGTIETPKPSDKPTEGRGGVKRR